MLIEQGLFGTIDKVQMAIDRIKTFEPPEGYYVATSFGKDSVSVMDLVKRSGVKADYHYNVTGIDPPELYRFGKKTFPFVQFHRSEMTMWQLIVKKRMPPTRMVRYCCEYLKERGGSGRVVVTGIRWAESTRRSKRRMHEACFKDNRKLYFNPIIDWSDSDVWDYIHQNNVPYCSLYDEGFKRLGCILCPMSRNRIKEAERWPRFVALYRKAIDRCVEKRLTDGLTTDRRGNEFRHKWSTGAEMWDWWLNAEDRGKEDPDQSVMFE